MKLLIFLMLGAAVSAALPAQTVYVPVNAPYAQKLLIAEKEAHPELQKLGLHAIPPGQQAYAIIANPIWSKIGKLSSKNDLAVITSGKATVEDNGKERFYDLRLPISDASGSPIGLTVMEIPYGSARDANDALTKATVIRDEIQKKISGHDQLFETVDAPMTVMPAIPFDGSIKGHFDHFGVDIKHNRLFTAAEDSHAVVVFDLVNGTVLKEINGLARPHAVLYRDDLNRLYVTDGGDGALKIYDGKSYELIGMVPLQKDADSIGYEPSSKYLFIDNGGKDAGNGFSYVTSVDTSSGTKVADIRVESETLEAMAVDIWRPRIYVNDATHSQVTVIDRVKKAVIASWPLTMAKDNVAMGHDEQRQRLFVGCRSGQIVVMDSNTGKELQTLPISKGVDDVEFDPASKRLYAIGNGTLEVFEETDADHYRSLASFSVGADARTGRLAAAINRYFAAVPASENAPAKVAVLQPVNTPLPAAVSSEVPQPVTAPHALKLVLETMSAHPYLRKMGLHAIPPGGKDSVIIANVNTSRIGNKSSQGDLDAVKDGKTYTAKKTDGSFINAKLPLKDASGNVIGILVMEIPLTSAPTEEQAAQEAESIREELSQKISDYQSLFLPK
ncbi:YncE family protein [Acidicapsa dinghuensis]|uniref:YncE family protein n=1 Tax=Acidicapsa dinghuensis TaxID=2218256 RepID=A0ABW1ECQ7_9BACT|nr:YncE family protein [Acidicapsa dinghuensis]